MSSPLIAFAGGGTGGHLFPGLAVAEELIDRGADCVFMGSGTELEVRELREKDIQFRKLYVNRRSGSLCSIPINIVQSIGDVIGSSRFFKKERVKVVVGLGAASMTGPVLGAVLAGIPRLLLEQNVLPGRATRVVAGFAGEVITSWSKSSERLRKNVVSTFLGNPVRKEILALPRNESAACFGFDPALKTVLVLGGSQGASAVNRAFSASTEHWIEMGVQVIHLTGEADRDIVEQEYIGEKLKASVYAFYGKMGFAYGAADLVVSRAGGSALAEIAANGKPAIVVPYPYAVDDHQLLNARAFEEEGCCVVVEEGEFFKERLHTAISGLLGNDNRLARMAERSGSFGKRSAASEVAARVMELAEC